VGRLVPEPQNKHDRNAVAVVCRGIPVGYLPRADASRYAARIGELAGRGLALHVRARVWLGRRPYGTTPPATTRPGRTQVRLALPEAHLLGPVNAPPTEPYAILPYGSAIQVNGEENHREAIAPFLARDGDCWVIATLHRSERDGTRAVKSLAEVRIDGAKVGVLTPKMSSENLPAVDFLAEQGAVAAVRARVKGNRIKAEVVLYCCRAHEISEDWFSRPVCAPNDWSPFRAEEDAREGANGRRLPSVRNRSVERPERTPVRLRQSMPLRHRCPRQTGTPTRASRVSGGTGTERRGRWVRPAGIEPATKCLEGTCSIR
jgi:HIRAN domain-containing protein